LEKVISVVEIILIQKCHLPLRMQLNITPNIICLENISREVAKYQPEDAHEKADVENDYY